MRLKGLTNAEKDISLNLQFDLRNAESYQILFHTKFQYQHNFIHKTYAR